MSQRTRDRFFRNINKNLPSASGPLVFPVSFDQRFLWLFFGAAFDIIGHRIVKSSSCTLQSSKCFYHMESIIISPSCLFMKYAQFTSESSRLRKNHKEHSRYCSLLNNTSKYSYFFGDITLMKCTRKKLNSAHW